jgi:hypothetical protein
MGLPVLGRKYLVYIILQVTRKKMWYPKRMKGAIEAMRNKEMGSCKASRVFNLPQKKKKHLGVMLKTGRKAQVKQ